RPRKIGAADWPPTACRRPGLSKNGPPASSSHETPQLRCDYVKEDSKQDTADHFRTPSSSWRGPLAIFPSARLPSPQDARAPSAQFHSERYCPPRLLKQGELR